MKIGKLVKGTGRIIGTLVEYNIKITGEVIGTVADAADKPKLAEGSRKFTRALGEFVGDVSKLSSEAVGDTVDKAIDVGTKTVNKIGDLVIKENTIEIDEKGNIKDIKYIKNVDYEIIDE